MEPIDKETLDWIEKRAHENLLSKIAGAAEIKASANLTLTVLLAGIGGSLAYAVKLVDGVHGPVEVGAAALCAYLVLWAIVLLRTTMMFTKVPATANDAANLLDALADRTFEQLRRDELEIEQRRIALFAAYNDARAPWVNNVRIATAVSPVVFFVAAYLAR